MPLRFSLANGDEDDWSMILGNRGESSTTEVAPGGGSGSLMGRPNSDINASRPFEILLQRIVSGIFQNGRTGSPPASKAAIAAMPTFKVGKQTFGSDACGTTDEALNECAVCKEVFEIGGEVKEMPCKHFYHSDCILPWLELHSTCPLCRKEMPVEVEEESSSSLTSESTGRAAGGEPAIVFIGVSGTGVVVFSFIILGNASRNEVAAITDPGANQSPHIPSSTDSMGEAGSESGTSTSDVVTTDAVRGAEDVINEISMETLGNNTVMHLETSAPEGFLPSPTNDVLEGSDVSGSLSDGRVIPTLYTEDNDGGSLLEDCSENVKKEFSSLENEPGPSSMRDNMDTWTGSRQQQLAGGNGAESSFGSRGRGFFSWLFRHATARPGDGIASESDGANQNVT
ncbi:hypothetical protein KP509_07G095600 [Ceratopteris richardii]|nr:hypothetical protein KP509_07G095600 [Ceratopteris richardii]